MREVKKKRTAKAEKNEEEKGEKRKREEEKDENETGAVKRRCVWRVTRIFLGKTLGWVLELVCL